MSAADIAKQLFGVAAGAVQAAGRVGMEIAEVKIPQGAAELASALFSQSNAFVQYGPTNEKIGQDKETGMHGAEAQKEQPEHANEGMSR